MVWRFQFSWLQLSGRVGHSGGLGAGLELCAGVCVRQLALVSALLGVGGSAGNFSTLRHIILLRIAVCCCSEDTISFKISPVQIFFF